MQNVKYKMENQPFRGHISLPMRKPTEASYERLTRVGQRVDKAVPKYALYGEDNKKSEYIMLNGD